MSHLRVGFLFVRRVKPPAFTTSDKCIDTADMSCMCWAVGTAKTKCCLHITGEKKKVNHQDAVNFFIYMCDKLTVHYFHFVGDNRRRQRLSLVSQMIH